MTHQASNPEHKAFSHPSGGTIFDRFGYSAAVRAGDFIYVSGQIGLAPDGTIPDDDTSQFENAFERLKLVLEAAGGSMANVVELVSYHVGLQTHMAEFVEVKARHLSPPLPAWSAIGVAGLARQGLTIELKAVAYLPR